MRISLLLLSLQPKMFFFGFEIIFFTCVKLYEKNNFVILVFLGPFATPIGHFRVPKTLTLKTWLSAKPVF